LIVGPHVGTHNMQQLILGSPVVLAPISAKESKVSTTS